jgi:hypothetical protein
MKQQATEILESKNCPSNVTEIGSHLKKIKKLSDLLEEKSLFSSADVKNLESFCKRLEGGITDPVSSYVRNCLSESTNEALKDRSHLKKLDHLKQLLVSDLNRLICGAVIYDRERFAKIELRGQTQAILKHNPEGSFSRERLNRSLLEDAYPKELAKSRFSPLEKAQFLYKSNEFRQLDADYELFHRELFLQRHFLSLVEDAEKGYVNALRELAYTAETTTRLLDYLAAVDPDYVTMVAEERTVWPLLVGYTEATDTQKSDLKTIHLNYGRSGPVARAAATEWILKLLKLLNFLRGNLSSEKVPMQSSERKSFWYTRSVPDQTDVIKLYQRLNADAQLEIKTSATQLPSQDESTAPALWWQWIKNTFLKITGNEPWKLSEFANVQRHSWVDTLQNKDGRMRDQVVKALQQSFKTVFPIKA